MDSIDVFIAKMKSRVAEKSKKMGYENNEILVNNTIIGNVFTSSLLFSGSDNVQRMEITDDQVKKILLILTDYQLDMIFKFYENKLEKKNLEKIEK